jgi:hypothetical protein
MPDGEKEPKLDDLVTRAERLLQVTRTLHEAVADNSLRADELHAILESLKEQRSKPGEGNA